MRRQIDVMESIKNSMCVNGRGGFKCFFNNISLDVITKTTDY